MRPRENTRPAVFLLRNFAKRPARRLPESWDSEVVREKDSVRSALPDRYRFQVKFGRFQPFFPTISTRGKVPQPIVIVRLAVYSPSSHWRDWSIFKTSAFGHSATSPRPCLQALAIVSKSGEMSTTPVRGFLPACRHGKASETES